MVKFFRTGGTPVRSIRNAKKSGNDSSNKSGTLRGRGSASAGKKDAGKGPNAKGKPDATPRSAKGGKSNDSKDDKEKGEKEGESEGKEEPEEDERRFDGSGYDRELVEMLG
jgi:hypothetical protein